MCQPAAQIVVAVAVLGAAVAAVRSRIMASVRACKECRGYGIERRAHQQTLVKLLSVALVGYGRC